jgi:hypothetical protein
MYKDRQPREHAPPDVCKETSMCIETGCRASYSDSDLLYTPLYQDEGSGAVESTVEGPPTLEPEAPQAAAAQRPLPVDPEPAPLQPLAASLAPAGFLGVLGSPAALAYEEVAGTVSALVENPARLIPGALEGLAAPVFAAALVLLTPSKAGDGSAPDSPGAPGQPPSPGDPGPGTDLGPAIGAYLLYRAVDGARSSTPRDFNEAGSPGRTEIGFRGVNGELLPQRGFLPPADEAPPGFLPVGQQPPADPDRASASANGNNTGDGSPATGGAGNDGAEHSAAEEASAEEADTGGVAVPVKTASRKAVQLEELVQAGTTDTHQHPTTDRHGGYNRTLLTPHAAFAEWVRDLGPDARLVLSAIPQALDKGCCPNQPYYLSLNLNTAVTGAKPLDPVMGYVYPNGTIRFKEDNIIQDSYGEPMLFPKGTYRLTELGLNPETRPPELPQRGFKLASVNFIPGSATLPLDGSQRMRELINFYALTVKTQPDVAPKLALGLTNVSPRLANGGEELKNALAYMVQVYPDVEFRVAGLGEVNFFNKEAVEYMVSMSGESPHSMENADKFLGFLNDEVPGAMVVVHSDAGRSIESGLAGAPVRLLFSGQTEYTNVEKIIEIANRYPNVNFVWAHAGGLSRSGSPGDYVDPNGVHGLHTDMLKHVFDSAPNVFVDMSWGTVAEKVVADNYQNQTWATPNGGGIMNQYPDRFIYGSDAVGQDMKSYLEPLTRYTEGGIIQNLNMRELFLQINGKTLINAGAEAFDRYVATHRQELQDRPLTGEWSTRSATGRPPPQTPREGTE